MFIDSIKLILLDHCYSRNVLFNHCSHEGSSGCVCIYNGKVSVGTYAEVSDPISVSVLARFLCESVCVDIVLGMVPCVWSVFRRMR